MRIINGYVTVEPPLTYQKHRRRMEIYEIDREPSSPSSTSPSPSSAQLAHSTVTLSCALAWLLSHILFTSWPKESVTSWETLGTLLHPHQSSGVYLIKPNKEWLSGRNISVRIRRLNVGRSGLHHRARSASGCWNANVFKNLPSLIMCGISSVLRKKQNVDYVELQWCQVQTSWKY